MRKEEEEHIKTAIDKSIKGHRESQKFLYQTYAPYLLTVTRRYSFKRVDPKDVLQESFLEIFKHLERYNPKLGLFRSWITTITIRKAIKINSKALKPLNLIESAESIADTQETPIEKMSAEELLSLIDKLPDSYKVIFNMAVIDNYSHKEISKLLGIKESTSRSKLKRARDMIINSLQVLSKHEEAYGKR